MNALSSKPRPLRVHHKHGTLSVPSQNTSIIQGPCYFQPQPCKVCDPINLGLCGRTAGWLEDGGTNMNTNMSGKKTEEFLKFNEWVS